MRLYEVIAPDPNVTKLLAVLSQLKSDMESGEEHTDWTVPELLSYFKKQDIIIDVSDLLDMISVPPMNKFIENIQGDKVVFVGSDDEFSHSDPEKNDDIVKKMAKHALTK